MPEIILTRDVLVGRTAPVSKATHLNVPSKFVSCRKYMLLLRRLYSILDRRLLRSRQSSEPQLLFLGRGSGGQRHRDINRKWHTNRHRFPINTHCLHFPHTLGPLPPQQGTHVSPDQPRSPGILLLMDHPFTDVTILSHSKNTRSSSPLFQCRII